MYDLYLTIPVPLSLNQLYINQYGWNPKMRMSVPTGKRILSKDGEKSKKEIIKAVKEQIKTQDWDYEYTEENFVYMDMIIYFNRKGRDDNNVTKLLADSLEKIVYDNDSRVLIRTQRIYYDTENPRIELHIHPVDYIGIFDNGEALNKFEDNCKSCSRYLNGRCKILQLSKEGRIQKEIDKELNCEKYKQKK
jgi:Holliday junction resolvase RusA-like endonuclease